MQTNAKLVGRSVKNIHTQAVSTVTDYDPVLRVLILDHGDGKRDRWSWPLFWVNHEIIDENETPPKS